MSSRARDLEQSESAHGTRTTESRGHQSVVEAKADGASRTDSALATAPNSRLLHQQTVSLRLSLSLSTCALLLSYHRHCDFACVCAGTRHSPYLHSKQAAAHLIYFVRFSSVVVSSGCPMWSVPATAPAIHNTGLSFHS